MAKIINEPCHTFNEYLLIPGYTPITCRSEKVSLKTPLVKYRKGEEPAITMNIPMISAIMQSVSGDRLAVALAKEGGVSFIYGSQSIEDEAAMVKRAKSYKAGFVRSDSNISPNETLRDVLRLKEETGHSTIAVTEDGTADGKLVGVVTSRDYRVSRMEPDTPVSAFMTPFDKLIWAKEGTTLKEANDIIWDHKLNSLPIIDDNGRLCYFVFRKDYESHKQNPNELLDAHKRYVVGAGINTRDYEKRVPALLEAGADVLCIDSSEGHTDWQRFTLAWIREKYGDSVKVGAGNVVDAAGFRFLAECGADFVKVGIGGITITDTRLETMDMSEGYLGNGKTILCRKEDAGKYTCQEDLNHPEVRVMVNPGGLNEKFARANLPNCTLIVFDKNEEIPNQVAEGNADIMITEITEAPWYVQNDTRLAAPLLDKPFTRGQIGVLMRKGQEDLMDVVNATIRQMKADGRLRQLHEKYGLIYAY